MCISPFLFLFQEVALMSLSVVSVMYSSLFRVLVRHFHSPRVLKF